MPQSHGNDGAAADDENDLCTDRDTIYLQIGFNTKAGSPGYGFSTCSFPVSFRENNYVLISIFWTLWISLPRRMSLPSCGLGLEVSESFRCFCSFLNVTLRAAFQTAGGGYTTYIRRKTNPFFTKRQQITSVNNCNYGLSPTNKYRLQIDQSQNTTP